MSEKNIKSRIVHKHDTEANWLKATTFVPKQGEFIIYDKDATYDYERFKIGDGVTVVSNLPFSDDNIKTLINSVKDLIGESCAITTTNADGSMTLTNVMALDAGLYYFEQPVALPEYTGNTQLIDAKILTPPNEFGGLCYVDSGTIKIYNMGLWVVLSTNSEGTIVYGEFGDLAGISNAIVPLDLVKDIISWSTNTSDLTPQQILQYYSAGRAITFNGVPCFPFGVSDSKVELIANTGDGYVFITINADKSVSLEGKSLIVSPGTASVGQAVVVKSVDSEGYPTEWKYVDLQNRIILTDQVNGYDYIIQMENGNLVSRQVPR